MRMCIGGDPVATNQASDELWDTKFVVGGQQRPVPVVLCRVTEGVSLIKIHSINFYRS